MITLYRFDFEYIQMLQREYLIVVRYFIADGGCSRDLFSVVRVFVLIKLNQDKISQVTFDKQCTKDLNDDDWSFWQQTFDYWPKQHIMHLKYDALIDQGFLDK